MASLPIPARCAHRPTVGGIVIPWITVTLADGTPDWRACIRHRVNACLTHRRCQIDGQPITGPAVFFAADDQIEPGGRVITDIPPVHPECRPYSIATCPMLNGQRTTYADRPTRCATSKGNRCSDPGCGCGGYVSVEPDRDMAGHEIAGWVEVWADRWAVTSSDSTGGLFAVIDRPRRVRPVRRAVTADA